MTLELQLVEYLYWQALLPVEIVGQELSGQSVRPLVPTSGHGPAHADHCHQH